MTPSFYKEILADIDWRYSELSVLRTLPFRYKLSTDHHQFLIKYSVPVIYSIWEGYVKSVFEIYVRELNNLNIESDKINYRLLAHAIDSDSKLTLQNSRIHFKTKTEFTESLMSFLSQRIEIPNKTPTNSNINFEVLNDILERFNLEPLPIKNFKTPLNKLLRFRNSVSHGDNSIPVTAKDIEKFCELVNDLMSEVCERIEKGFETKTFLA
ncbi:MAE_28990/MAE_18760 family HEPN-like nuclease [Roseivirga sp. E12]|uniref:MAE_28990/MAE_18760 family HEPN-like nuclease n=1 Tax=Roseivirga sp. E12 TaxID=2819237 RepID=UPI001ABD2679|nr:MAE_28990/MAE_18760 family HEPN-like nuclease [Roseivirga sp. E12]MBO3696827.1 hypothetical protein [Roseivirga sp. E12]